MSDDDQRPSSGRPAARLLDELEAIKGTLANGHDSPAEMPVNIPLLDDMVIENLDSNADLLNIGQIFDDEPVAVTPPVAEQTMQFPRFKLDVAISDNDEITSEMPITEPTLAPPPMSTPPVSTSAPASTPRTPTPPVSSTPTRVRPDYSREVLIQELVDEFIPQIETELHKRLGQLDDAALRHLKESK